MDPFIATVLLVAIAVAAIPPAIFAWQLRAPRLAVVAIAIGLATPPLYLLWIPIGIGGDYYKQLGALLTGLPVLVVATCILLCVMVWGVRQVLRRKSQDEVS